MNATKESRQGGCGSHDLFDEGKVELDPNEVQPGMHVSILRWKPFVDFSWVGDVMHVVSVNPPFIAVNLRRKHGTSRMTLDVRNVALVRLREDFVEACEVSPSTLPSNDLAEARRNDASPSEKP